MEEEQLYRRRISIRRRPITLESTEDFNSMLRTAVPSEIRYGYNDSMTTTGLEDLRQQLCERLDEQWLMLQQLTQLVHETNRQTAFLANALAQERQARYIERASASSSSGYGSPVNSPYICYEEKAIQPQTRKPFRFNPQTKDDSIKVGTTRDIGRSQHQHKKRRGPTLSIKEFMAQTVASPTITNSRSNDSAKIDHKPAAVIAVKKKETGDLDEVDPVNTRVALQDDVPCTDLCISKEQLKSSSSNLLGVSKTMAIGQTGLEDGGGIPGKVRCARKRQHRLHESKVAAPCSTKSKGRSVLELARVFDHG